MRGMPAPRRVDGLFEVGKSRLPPQNISRGVGLRYENCRIARSAWLIVYANAASAHLLDGVHHFTDRVPFACTDIQRSGLAAIGEVPQRADVSVGEIADMDVIA